MPSDDPSPRASLAFQSMQQAAALLAGGEILATDLVDACHSTFAAGHADINALVVHDFERARADARASDARRRAGRSLGPFDGIPFSIKESFDVAGWPTTCGHPAHRNHVAERDATVAARLRAQGAVLLGKTNVPLSLRDWQSYNAIYGTTRNPRDLTRTPGGSSGGSAAAVCAGMSFFDIGSDIGSSLRNPAHYCGVFSHKSSHGLVSLLGHGVGGGSVTQEINVAGPIARSAFDLERILLAIAGPDGAEAQAYQLRLPDCPQRRLADFRVAILPTHPLAEVDAEIQDKLHALGAWLIARGVSVSNPARPTLDADALWRAYVLMLRATTSCYMDDGAFDAALAQAGSVAPEDRSYGGLQYAGATLRHRDWLRLQKARDEFSLAWQRFFADYDVLLCPAAATTAFPIDEAGEPWQRTLVVNGKPQPMTTQLFWAGHSGLCGLPSTVAPLGPGRSGLPVGVQIVARRFGDLTSLRFAQALESEGFAYVPPAAWSGEMRAALPA